MYSTLRDITNEFAIVGSQYAGTAIGWNLSCEIVYNEREDSAYQRWVILESINGNIIGRCWLGNRNSVIEALRDIEDLDYNEELAEIKKKNSFCARMVREMKERKENG